MSKVSFILPAYKRRFLKEAIASILAQTYRDFELVVVDDCSPENLKDVVDEFRDARLSYCRNEQNIGGRDLVAAWNHAMGYATGEWCVLASDDDVYDHDYLAEMVRLSLKYPTVDVFHCRIAFIRADGSVFAIGDSRAEYETGAEMLYNTAIKRIALRAPDIMFRKAALVAIGGFIYSPRAWFTDIGTWCRLSRDKGAVCSSRVLFKWRESGENISNVHSDADEKLLAARLFRPWLRDLIESTPCRNWLDRYFLDKSRTCYNVPINWVVRHVVLHSPWKVWLKIVVNGCGEAIPMRLRFIKDRIFARG